MTNPYSAPETVEPNVDRNVSAENSPILLARIIRWVALGCLVFIVVRIVFGHGVIGGAQKAGVALFWLFVAMLVAKFPRKSGVFVGNFMLLSVFAQTYFLQRALSGLSKGRFQKVADFGMSTKFYISLLPMSIGGAPASACFGCSSSRTKP